MQSPMRATTDANGDSTVEYLDDYAPATSADAPITGTRVLRGIEKINVASPADIRDNDVVLVDGMEITGKIARDLGLLAQAFPEDGGLAVGSAAAAAEAKAAEANTGADDGVTPLVDTGDAQADAVTNGLNAALDNEVMDPSEAFAYDAVAGSFALADVDLHDAVDLANGLHDGSIDPNAVDITQRQNVEAAEKTVTAQATKSAQAELGGEVYDWLASVRARPGRLVLEETQTHPWRAA